MSAYGNLLNPSRRERIPLGAKADRQYHSITHNPSTINSGETLYVRIPKLRRDVVIVPGTLKLNFDLNKKGHANNHFVNNVGRALQAHVVDKLGGEILSDQNNYFIYQTYQDLWLSEKQRKNLVLQGVGTSNLRKMRSGAGDADKGELGDNALKKACGVKHVIPLDFEIYSDHGPFYPYVIAEDFIREITFNDVKYVVNASDAKDIDYTVTNIAIEYETINSPEIARQVDVDYKNGITFLYDYVTYFKTQKITEKTFNINVNIPRRSMKGVLVFFEKAFAAGAFNSETTPFQNPGITDVQVTIEGLSNRVYAQGFKAHQQWDEACRRFMPKNVESNMDMESFYGDDKFALWLDLRSTEDNKLHGSGLKLVNTNDGVQLAITRTTATEYTMHVFVVADAQVSIENNQLRDIMF